MKFEVELVGYNEWDFKDSAIPVVLNRNFGGIWTVRRLPSEPVAYPLNEQADDYIQGLKDKWAGEKK